MEKLRKPVPLILVITILRIFNLHLLLDSS
jgi:hypothetical protein